jgi:hypothetical protein
MVIECNTKDLVIVFEDKSGEFRTDGYLGQIVSELIMCQYHNHNLPNHDHDTETTVYLLRFYKHYVS